MEMRSLLMGAAVPKKNGSQIRITTHSVLLAAGSIGLTCILVDASLICLLTAVVLRSLLALHLFYRFVVSPFCLQSTYERPRCV
jgi:hypothetical protein